MKALQMIIWRWPRAETSLAHNKSFPEYMGTKEGDTVNVLSDKVVSSSVYSSLDCPQGGYQELLTDAWEANKGQDGFQTEDGSRNTMARISSVCFYLYLTFNLKGVPVINMDGVLTQWWHVHSRRWG
jgi:hypothetical protein